jgi:hypothetical protein
MPRQTSISSTDTTAAASITPPDNKLTVSALQFGQESISPAQKRFNQLLKQTETLAQKIEDTRHLADAHRLLMAKILPPLQAKRHALMRDMALWLDARLQRKGLSAKQKSIASEILSHLAAGLASQGDQDMADLFDKHNDGPMQDEKTATAADMNSFMEDLFGEKIGAKYDSLDEMFFANMAKMQEQAAAEAAARAEKKSKRKKSAAQLKAEAAATAQTEDATGALRTLYRQLVSALHPDRETDPQEQARKTALMKEANKAYKSRDLLGLLQLQLRAKLTNASQMANLAKEKMAALSTLLKDRVKVLTAELYAMERETMGEFQLPIYQRLSARTLRSHLSDLELDLQEEIQQMAQDLILVQNDAYFKRWLREQDDAMQDEFDCPF